jgi:alpha-tubulin suppressor-like RCC1 family protein
MASVEPEKQATKRYLNPNLFRTFLQSKIYHAAKGAITHVHSTNSDAIDTDGTLWTCGQGDYGQLGHKSDEDQAEFTRVQLKGRKAALVDGGTHFTIVALTDSM